MVTVRFSRFVSFVVYTFVTMMQNALAMRLERANPRIGLNQPQRLEKPSEPSKNAGKIWRKSVAMTNPKYFMNQKRWERHRREAKAAAHYNFRCQLFH